MDDHEIGMTGCAPCQGMLQTGRNAILRPWFSAVHSLLSYRLIERLSNGRIVTDYSINFS